MCSNIVDTFLARHKTKHTSTIHIGKPGLCVTCIMSYRQHYLHAYLLNHHLSGLKYAKPDKNKSQEKWYLVVIVTNWVT